MIRARAEYDPDTGEILALHFGLSVLAEGVAFIEIDYAPDIQRTHKVVDGQLISKGEDA